jgi:hypothetical protein
MSDGLDLGRIGYETYINDKQYEKTLRKMENDAERSGKSIMKSLFGALSIYSGYRFFKGLVQSASDLIEAENKFRVVFQSIGDSAEKARKRLQKAFGRSKLESAELLGNAGDILTGLGFSAEAALKMSSQAAELSIDLTSLQNYKGGAKGAMEAMTALMVGETERAKALGILVRQESAEFKNLVKHYMEVEKMTLEQAKAQAALDIAIKQSKNAIGDYARTAEEFANSSRRAGERIQDIASKLGKNLIPLASKIIRLISWGTDVLGDMNGTLVSSTAYFGIWIASMYGLEKVFGIMGKIKNAVNEAAVNAGYMSAEALAAKQAEELKVAENLKSNAIRRAQNKKRALDEAVNYKMEAKTAFKAERQKYAEAKKAGTATLEQKEKLKNAAGKYRQSLASLTRAERQYRRAQIAANITSARASATLNRNTIATKVNATAKYALGRAVLFTKACFKSLWAAIVANPIGAILAVLGLAISAMNAWGDSIRQTAAEQIELAKNASELADKRLDSGNKQRLADLDSLDRLKRLATAERLSNDEKAEAKELIDDLSKRYGDLGISIDKTTGKLNIQAGAFDKINKKMLAQAQAQRKAVIKKKMAEIEALKAENKALGSWGAQGFFWMNSESNKAKQDANAKRINALWDEVGAMKMAVRNATAVDKENDQERKNKVRQAKNAATKKKYKEYEEQEAEWRNNRLSDYERELKAINEIVDAQKMRAQELYRLKELSKEDLEASLKLAESERKRLTDKLNAERQAEEARKQAQRAELSRDLEYNRLKAQFLADGKLDRQENISLAEKEVELQKQRVAEAKKAAEQAKAENKAQTENALAQAQIELGEKMRDLKALTDAPLKARRSISQTGGFLATRVSLIGNQDPAKETAKNTKDIVKHVKKTEQNTKKIAEKTLTFD